MPEYDSKDFDPPAPVAHVILKNMATGVSLSDVPLLIDTGADVTLLPAWAINQLEIEPEDDTLFEVQGFDGEIKLVKMVKLELFFLQRKFAGQFLVVDEKTGMLGRNILNSLSISFNGPQNSWNENK